MSCGPPSLLPTHRRLEGGQLWLEKVALEPGDVVPREAAPVGAEGGAGCGILGEVVEEFGQSLGA